MARTTSRRAAASAAARASSSKSARIAAVVAVAVAAFAPPPPCSSFLLPSNPPRARLITPPRPSSFSRAAPAATARRQKTTRGARGGGAVMFAPPLRSSASEVEGDVGKRVASPDDDDDASSSSSSSEEGGGVAQSSSRSNLLTTPAGTAFREREEEEEEPQQREAQEAKSAAVLDAERLRARARELLSEASEAESALRSTLLEKKSASDADLDSTVSQLIRIREAVPEVSGEDTEVARKFESAMGENLPRWVLEREAERQRRKRKVKALAGWMREGRATTERLVKVAERVYEREKTARGGRPRPRPKTLVDASVGVTTGEASAGGTEAEVTAVGVGTGEETEQSASLENVLGAPVDAPQPLGAGESFQIGATSNVAKNNEAELKSLDGLIDEIIDACDLLDEERREAETMAKEEKDEKADGVKESSSSLDESSPGKESNGGAAEVKRHYGLSSNAGNVLRSRMKDLRRADDEALRRRLASEMRSYGSDASGGRRRVQLKKGQSIEDLVQRTLSSSDSDSANKTSMEIEVLGGAGSGGAGDKDFNVTRFVVDVLRVPLWVPPSLLPYVATCPDELSPEDAKLIKTDVLEGSTFRCSGGWDSFEKGAIYRGMFVDAGTARRVAAMEGRSQSRLSSPSSSSLPSLSGNNTALTAEASPVSAQVFADVRSRLEAMPNGLADRVQLFLVDDPEWRPGDATEERGAGIRRRGGDDEKSAKAAPSGPPPVILAVPASVRPEQGGEDKGKGAKVLAALSVVSALFTTFAYGVAAYALNPTFFNAIMNDSDVSALTSVLPIFVGVWSVQAAHEAAHRVAAQRRDVRIGLPLPLPSLQIGTFGSITPLRSFPETRTDMMDVALAGPGIALALSLFLTTVGLGLTPGVASEEVLATFPVVPAALTKSSFLVGSLVSVLVPKVASLPLSQPVPVHPLFMVGLAGLVSSALNLLPVGRLDGGRAFSAAFGRRSAVLVSFLVLVTMAAAALSGTSQISIFWGLLVTVFQRNGDVPTRDEVTGVDGTRRGLYGALTGVALLALLPFPGGPGVL